MTTLQTLSWSSFLTLLLSLPLALAALIFLALNFSRLPPQVPLFASHLWGPKRLADKCFLFFLPAASLTLLAADIFLAERFYRRREGLPASAFLAAAGIASVLFSLAAFRTVHLLIRPYPLVEALWLSNVVARLGPPFAAAFAVSLVSCPFFVWLMRKVGAVDDPATHKHPAILHQKPTPRGGTAPVFLGILTGALTFLPLTKEIAGILLAVGLIVALGVLDDRFDLNPYLRLGVQFLAALIILAAGVNIVFVNNPFNGVLRLDIYDIPLNFPGGRHLPLPGSILTVLWIIFAANAVSWSNGVDGQFVGIVGLTAAVIALLSLRFVSYDPSQWGVAVLSSASAGAVLGTLPFSWHPARMFYGFGATGLGALLAALAILSGAKVATALLILLVPSVDAFVAVGRRLLSRRSPVWGDRQHLHHHLLDRGWTQPRVALFYWAATLLLGFLALYSSGKGKLLAILTAAGAIVFPLIVLNLKGEGGKKRLLKFGLKDPRET